MSMQVAHYLGLLHHAETNLAGALRELSDGHREESDVHHVARRLAAQCDEHARRLAPFAERYGEEVDDEPDRLHSEIFAGTREGGLGLLARVLYGALPR